jgi:hypothetical protein
MLESGMEPACEKGMAMKQIRYGSELCIASHTGPALSPSPLRI